MAELQRTHAKRVVGTVCDVRCVEGVEALAAFAVDAMGGVDIWINNAGSNGYSYAPLTNTDPMVLKEIVDTNVFGTLLCTRTAITLMAEQASGGHVFNMEVRLTLLPTLGASELTPEVPLREQLTRGVGAN